MPKTNREPTVTERIINRARDYIGTRSRVNRVNAFGQRHGMNGTYWDGSFIETVLAEENLTAGPSLVSTTGALAALNRANRLYQKPRPGDIAFFAWSADDNGLGQPHVGIVTEVKDWKRLGKIRTVEGMASSGLPRGPKEADGVYERTRYSTEILAFARPRYRSTTVQGNREPVEGLPTLRASHFPAKVTVTPYREVSILQRALHEATGITGFVEGVYDNFTRAAVSAFQREIGYTDGATGFPDRRTLAALSQRTHHRFFAVGE